jgi:anti-sigma factor RsiW
MKCEEFEAVGLGLGREGSVLNGVDAAERAAAIEHTNACPRCAALQESWQEAQVELRALRAATQDASTPPRVEMRLRQEFRTKHPAVKVRTAAMVAAWALAAAVVVVGVVSVRNWRSAEQPAAQNAAGGNVPAGAAKTNAADSDSANVNVLIADNNADDFTLLPGSLPQETDDPAIVRVRLQRGALGALGLPVNEERAGEWIQVDLLVGEDGQPQAVRLPQ